LVVTFPKEKIKRLEFLARIADKELDASPEHGEWETKGPMSPLKVTVEVALDTRTDQAAADCA
jgi:hypothetical protein